MSSAPEASASKRAPSTTALSTWPAASVKSPKSSVLTCLTPSAAAVVTSYDFGAATSQARGVGNEVSAGNNDVYLEIDNLQLNNGQIDASAEFSGGNGYDAYVGADAAGNSITGYACSECEGVIDARNSQTNTANISATASAATQGSTRAVLAGANAVGNAATFYVSRPGH